MNAGVNTVMNDPETWVLASHNAGKIKELRDILAPFGVRLIDAAEAGLDEPEETEATFDGNARLKAEAACRSSGLPSLADDSGLSVDLLGGEPGIYSARWAGEPRDFGRAMQRVQDDLVARGDSDRTARFVCVIALARPGGETVSYEGQVVGEIAWPPRGEGGFGYDPVFCPEGEDRTFAEMSAAEKKSMSHRGRALEKLVAAELRG